MHTVSAAPMAPIRLSAGVPSVSAINRGTKPSSGRFINTANNGAARLLRNDGGNANHVVRIRTVGTASNRDGIGARVEVTAGGDTRWQLVKTGSSYLSQSELPVHFGLGATTQVDRLTIYWPSGKRQVLENIPANQRLTVIEPERK